MSNRRLTRREFGRGAVIAGGAVAVVSSAQRLRAAADELPKRPLGKTGLEVSLLGLGCAAIRFDTTTEQQANRVVDSAVDHGINYVDVAPNYNEAETLLGNALKGKRDKVILVTKVEATAKQDATRQIELSLRNLRTDYLDVVHLHCVGRTERFPSLDVLVGEDGALQALRDAKKKGTIGHIGATTHLRPRRLQAILPTGDIEVVMCAANFVVTHTYNFEGTVFADAHRRGLGIAAMKVLGGDLQMALRGVPLATDEYYESAIRYALGIPGLSVAVIGMKNPAEVVQAVAAVKAYRPFSQDEISRLREQGKRMAAEWGELHGAVV